MLSIFIKLCYRFNLLTNGALLLGYHIELLSLAKKCKVPLHRLAQGHFFKVYCLLHDTDQPGSDVHKAQSVSFGNVDELWYTA